MIPDKTALITACEQILVERINELKMAEESAKESAASETKSSAGDKHETARELIHQERELVSRQKMETENLLDELKLIKASVHNDSVTKGSMVKTTIGYFFLGVSLGFVTINDLRIACISIASPIGGVLLGKKKNEQFTFQGKTIEIHEIS